MDLATSDRVYSDIMLLKSNNPTSYILFKFFQYYVKEFKPELNYININWQGASIEDREKIRPGNFDRSFMESDAFRKSMYLIRDPFNNSYNPAKSI